MMVLIVANFDGSLRRMIATSTSSGNLRCGKRLLAAATAVTLCGPMTAALMTWPMLLTATARLVES
eukprot:4972952-Prymnesium_polylepis.2